MSSPDSFTLELNVTPIPTIDAISEARLSFPLLSPEGCLRTAPKPLRLTWTQELRLWEATMTREVSRWAWEQLLQARQRKEDQRRRLRAAVAFRAEDLEAPPPTVIATPSVASTAIASNAVAPIGTTHVRFATYTSDAPLMLPDAGPVMSPSTDVSATHSQFPHRGAPTSWSTFLEDVLAAVNAATARADGEEAAAIQTTEEGTEDASEAGTAVEVRIGRRGNHRGQTSHRGRGTGPARASHPRNTPRPPRLPDDFWANVPPRYIPFNIWHNGQEVPAKYVTIQMTNDPYALGTMGAGCPVFRRPAHVAPRITREEVSARENTTLRTLGHDY